MKSAIIDGRRRDVIVREITDAELHAVTVTLARCGIYVEIVRDLFGSLCVWAQPMTTAHEVTVLGALHDLTDARIDWHWAVPS